MTEVDMAGEYDVKRPGIERSELHSLHNSHANNLGKKHWKHSYQGTVRSSLLSYPAYLDVVKRSARPTQSAGFVQPPRKERTKEITSPIGGTGLILSGYLSELIDQE